MKKEKMKAGIRSITAVVMILVMAVTLAACGMTESPTQVTEKFLKALQEGDSDTIKDVYADGSFDLSDNIYDTEKKSEKNNSESALDKEMEKQLQKKLLDFDYEVLSEKVNGDKATVKVKIKTYAFGSAFSDFVSDYIEQAFALAMSGASDKKLDELATTLFSQKLEKLKKKNYSKTVSIKLTKDDGKWKINKLSETGDFMNAISGGLISTISNYADAFSDSDE
jgi:DNA-binding protein YbaB